MSDQFLGEIRIFPFNFAPVGWALCDGQLILISQNTALFSLLGTFYGGNGMQNYALPNLQGCGALGMGDGAGLTQRVIGETGGSATVTLITAEIPSHGHNVMCAPTTGNAASPLGNSFGAALRGKPPGYAAAGGGTVAMSSSAVANAGGGSPHDNLQPYLTLNYCIALQGIFPSRA